MCAKFSVDSAYSLVVGGRKNGFHLINVQTFPAGMRISYFILQTQGLTCLRKSLANSMQ